MKYTILIIGFLALANASPMRAALSNKLAQKSANKLSEQANLSELTASCPNKTCGKCPGFERPKDLCENLTLSDLGCNCTVSDYDFGQDGSGLEGGFTTSVSNVANINTASGLQISTAPSTFSNETAQSQTCQLEKEAHIQRTNSTKQRRFDIQGCITVNECVKFCESGVVDECAHERSERNTDIHEGFGGNQTFGDL
jgi:hypothetical protein